MSRARDNADLGDSYGSLAVGVTGGSGLNALSASNLSAGTVPDARFPATLPAASGANLTALPAANVTGVLPVAVTGGSGLTGSTSLGTVTAGTLNSTVTFPAGHIIYSAHTDFGAGQFQSGIATVTLYSTTYVTVPSIASGNTLWAFFSGGYGESSAGYGTDWGFRINGVDYANLIKGTQNTEGGAMQKYVVFGSSATNVVVYIIATKTGSAYQQFRLGGSSPAILSVFIIK